MNALDAPERRVRENRRNPLAFLLFPMRRGVDAGIVEPWA
jgi:hypothetical protein